MMMTKVCISRVAYMCWKCR